MGEGLGGLLSDSIRRESKKELKVRCNSKPVWRVRTKGDEGFQPVEDMGMLRLLLTEFVRFYPNRKLTFQVEIATISWLEPEGRVRSKKNSFTFDVGAKGRVFRLYKTIPLTETWMTDPKRVEEAAEKVGGVVFDAIEALVRQGRA